LKESIRITSFVSAIVVGKTGENEYQLVAGQHRLEAAIKSGQKEVPAIVVDHATPLQLELIGIDDNLLHQKLSLAQEAKAMARRKAIFLKLAPEAARGGDRRSAKSKAQNGRSESFAGETAKATGRSKTAINRSARRGERIASDLMDIIDGTPLSTGEFLDRLTKMPPEEQAKCVKDSLEASGKPTQTGVPDVARDLARLRRSWAEACAEARTTFRQEVLAAS